MDPLTVQIAGKLGLDTLRFIEVGNNGVWSKIMDIAPILAGLVGVGLGLIGGFLGQWLQSRDENKRVILGKRSDVYFELSKMLAQVYSVYVTDKKQLPKIYANLESLNEWLNNLSFKFDESRLLLDKKTLDAWEKLNSKILFEHLGRAGDDMDIRMTGMDQATILQGLVDNIHDAMREFMNKTYHLGLQDTRKL